MNGEKSASIMSLRASRDSVGRKRNFDAAAKWKQAKSQVSSSQIVVETSVEPSESE